MSKMLPTLLLIVGCCPYLLAGLFQKLLGAHLFPPACLPARPPARPLVLPPADAGSNIHTLDDASVLGNFFCRDLGCWVADGVGPGSGSCDDTCMRAADIAEVQPALFVSPAFACRPRARSLARSLPHTSQRRPSLRSPWGVGVPVAGSAAAAAAAVAAAVAAGPGTGDGGVEQGLRGGGALGGRELGLAPRRCHVLRPRR